MVKCYNRGMNKMLFIYSFCPENIEKDEALHSAFRGEGSFWKKARTSQVVQWLRISLPMQGIEV